MSFNKIKQLFEELAALAPGARTERLAAADIGEQTRSALRRLLDLDDAMASDLEQVLPGHHEPIPAQIGPFAIDGLMGEGGMGRVYRAHREVSGVRQALAIKVIRRDRLDVATRARFQLERQVLAVLKHPHIASMVDVGETEDGQPYLALEYIEGQHITQYAAEKQLGLRARVQLFRDVASAVAYAHRNLIVHRDLKPSNVLVDADGTAKVIDFGIAKPLMSHFGESEVGETQTAQRFFSPHSAAPEQLQGGLVTPSCDVYGLGALLYELLCGKPVFDFSGMNGIGIEKTILTEEPKAPSTQVAAADQTSLDADPDLDAIALMCLRKGPEDRYSSVEKLIEDLDAWLDSRPVKARNGNGWYRLRRFAKRHSRRLGMAAAFLAVVLVAGGVAFDAYRTSAAQTVRADQFGKLLLDAIVIADPGQKNGADMSARDLIRSLSKSVSSAPSLAARDRQELLLTLADMQLRLLDYPAVAKILDATPEPPVQDHELYVKYQTRKAQLLRSQGKNEEALKVYDALLPMLSGDQRTEVELMKLRIRFSLGEDLALLPILDQMGSSKLSANLDSLRLGLMCDINRVMAKYEVAKAQCEEVVKISEGLYPHGLSTQMTRLSSLISLAQYLGDQALADQYTERLKSLIEAQYEPGTLPRLTLQTVLANRASHKGNNEEAARIQRDVVPLMAERMSPASSTLINETFELAQLELAAGNRDAAYRAFEQAIQMVDRALPVVHPNRLLMRVNYAATMARDGELAKAGEWASVIVKNAETEPGVKTWDVYPIAVALTSGGDYARDQTDAKRAQFQKDLKAAFEAAESPETRKEITDLIRALRGRGFQVDVELPPSP